MKFRIFLTFLLFGASLTQMFSQEGKTNRKGERVGEWVIVYTNQIPGSLLGFPNSDLVNWAKSLVPVDNETYSTIAQKRDLILQGKQINTVYVESCEYRDGLKQGPFIIKRYAYTAGIGLDATDSYTVLSGNYINSKLHGKVFVAQDYGDGTIRSCNLDYENGEVVNQKIFFQHYVYNKYAMDHGQIEELSVYKITGAIPYIVIASGRVVEDFRNHGKNQNDKKWRRTIYLSDTQRYILMYSVTAYPVGYCALSTDHSVTNVNEWIDKGFAYTEGWGSLLVGEKWRSDGSYRLFLVGKGNESHDITTFSDTSILMANYELLDGRFHGVGTVWRRNQNGKNGDKPWMVQQYVDDKLSGISEMYFEDGSLAVRADYLDGTLNGLVQVYGGSDSRYWPHHLNYKVRAGVTFMNENFFMGSTAAITKFMDIVATKGEAISPTSEYGLYQTGSYAPMNVDGEVYSMPSSDIECYWNGKTVVVLIADNAAGDVGNVLFFDNTGQLVYSLDELEAEYKKQVEQRQRENKERMNEPFTCGWCGKEAIMQNAVMWVDCLCFKTDGSKIDIYKGMAGTWHCSRACASQANKACCSRNGYRDEP